MADDARLFGASRAPGSAAPVVDQRHVAPGRYRSLRRLNDHDCAQVGWFGAALNWIVDCGMDRRRAVDQMAK